MRVLLTLSILSLLAFVSSLTVHLVPHSHDDVGWQVTVDQYYIGSVQYILTTVIEQLLVNPDRKFIYVEQAYFQRWWRQQNDQVQQQVRDLVNNGQLEFINGGWCMHDEASTHYIDMVDQTTYGHRFIKEQFGKTPKVGWQIDPFGHSATQAALLSGEVGFEALFFGRIDYQDYNVRAQSKRLEWIWRASESLGEEAQVFAGQFWNGYGPPSGFDFNIGSNDPPVQDDIRLDDYNVDQRVDDFVKAAQEQSKIFQGEDLMWTMGSDFNYEAAHEWFTNLDKLIAAVNKDGRVTARYSTPSEYVEAKHAANLTWTLKTDDIFPYADGADSYWTGYFTSRPALKQYVRVQSQFLQVARHIEALTGGDGNGTESLWEALGVAQHHDGVSGTAKQAVTFDYAKRLAVGGADSDMLIEAGLGKLLTKDGGDLPAFSYCPLANTSVCDPIAANPNNVVVLYNSLARARTELVRIPTSSATATVYDGNDDVVASQVVKLSTTNPARVSNSLNYELRFYATVPGIGASTFFIVTSSEQQKKIATPISPVKSTITTPEEHESDNSIYSNTIRTLKSITSKSSVAAPTVSISNQYWKLDFDANGLLSQVTDVMSGAVTPFAQNFYWYHSFQQDGQQNSGAYIFRPQDPNDAGTPVATSATINVITGDVSTEVQQTFAPWLTQTIRLGANSTEIQFEYTVGPIPVDDKQGKEIITRYTTNIASNATWYTDSNGREWQQRVRNQRPTWKWNPTQPVAGNYYPVNAGIWLADATNAFSILNDRSQGGSSLHDGEIELMVHRRLTKDDGRGVGEPLNEPGLDGKGLIITGIHYAQLTKTANIASVTRQLQQRVYSYLHQSYAPLTGQVTDYLTTHNSQFTALQTALPVNVELMSAYKTSANTFLIRLAHNFGVGEDQVLSQPVTLDLATIFITQLTPTSITEVSLTANQTPQDIINNQLKWNIQGEESNEDKKSRRGIMAGTQITINPAEIRTFIFTY